MRQDAGIILKSGNFSVPRNFTPELIVDLGTRTLYSTLDYARQYPEAKILSFQTYHPNFLLDENRLAYHDNITFRSFSITEDLDYLIYTEIPFERQIDFIKVDLDGLEKNILKSGGRWSQNTRFIKARLTNYDYKEAKSDLHKLGFYSAAMHDGHSFYVIGERID